MGDVVELITKTAVARVGKLEKRPGPKAKSRRGTRRFPARSEEPVREVNGQAPAPRTAAVQEPEETGSGPVPAVSAGAGSPGPGLPAPIDEAPEGRAVPSGGKKEPGECLEVFEAGKGAVILYWKLETMDDWTAPVFGQVCQAVLRRPEIRLVAADLSRVEEMSTLAVATLVRFRNTLLGLERRLWVVVNESLRRQWEEASIARMFEIRENAYPLAGQEVRLVSERGGRRRPFWRRWLPW
jgi:anti-anti-sigma regulatory factor